LKPNFGTFHTEGRNIKVITSAFIYDKQQTGKYILFLASLAKRDAIAKLVVFLSVVSLSTQFEIEQSTHNVDD
jgi:hypothetical protein